MTCVAWRNGVLAADTQDTTADGTKLRVRKIESFIDGGHIAYAGDSALGHRVRRWIDRGMPMRGKPRIKDDDDFDALVMKADGSAWILTYALDLEPITMPFFAIGSGAAYALGAMACGRGAVFAVKVAARFDVNTSGPVNAVTAAAAVIRTAPAT